MFRLSGEVAPRQAAESHGSVVVQLRPDEEKQVIISVISCVPEVQAAANSRSGLLRHGRRSLCAPAVQALLADGASPAESQLGGLEPQAWRHFTLHLSSAEVTISLGRRRPQRPRLICSNRVQRHLRASTLLYEVHAE